MRKIGLRILVGFLLSFVVRNYFNNKKFGFLDVKLVAEQSEGEAWGKINYTQIPTIPNNKNVKTLGRGMRLFFF